MSPSRIILRLLPLLLLGVAPLRAQLRVVDYNTAGDARTGINTIFAAIGAESVNGIAKAPDVISLQEQDSSASTTQQIVDILNALYGAGTYARATLDGATSGAGRPGMIYNTKTVSLIAQVAVGAVSTSGAARQTLRYQLRPLGYDSAADFYVYSSHYKASSGSSNAARRNVEALAIRANADALGQGAHILYTGDFNIYGSSEPMWGTLTAAGNGQAFDPINRVGAWSNNSAFLDVHTQSPVTTSRYGGQITGGMDDRFDFQLATSEFLDNEGLSYISGSYHAFGNTGTHAFNGEITSGSAAALAARLPGYTAAQATAVLTAITNVSDHLPVVADYQIPAKMSVSASVPSRVLVGADVSAQVTVSNVAPVVASNGADELDFALSASGGLAGGATGSVLALTPGQVVSLGMDTATVGARSGGVAVDSSSQAVANGHFSGDVAYTVLDHAQPAFALDGGSDTLELDLGTVVLDSADPAVTFTIHNLVSALGPTAGLDLDSVIESGNAAFFLTTLGAFQDLEAGDSLSFTMTLLSGSPGAFSATYELRFSDEDLPGAADVGSLWIHASGAVVAAPEPGTVVLLALGVVLMACAKTRRN